MKLFALFTASLAVASAGQVYNNQQPIENYASPEIYQSALEYQQQGAYIDQPQGFVAQHNERRLADKAARILAYQSENNVHNYQYAYETENGIKGQEIGQALGAGTAAQGGFSYTGDDGQVYTVSYTADENGFRPSGAHIPTPPPIPEAILKSLEQNAKDEAAGIFDDGKYRGEQHAIHASPAPAQIVPQFEANYQPEQTYPPSAQENYTPQVTITQSAESGYQHL